MSKEWVCGFCKEKFDNLTKFEVHYWNCRPDDVKSEKELYYDRCIRWVGDGSKFTGKEVIKIMKNELK